MKTEKDSVAQETKIYDALDRLTKQEGWKYLLEHLNTVKKVITEALLVEIDPKKVVRLQERYRAFDSVISTIESAKDIKERLMIDLMAIIEAEKAKEEFGI